MVDHWKYYQKVSGNRCPLCESSHIIAHPFNADGLSAWRDVECTECEETWREMFSMQNIDILELGEKKENHNFGSHIDKAEAQQTGGYVMVDYLTLTDGFRIGVSDECISYLVKWADSKGDEGDEYDYVEHYQHGDDYKIEGGSLSHIDEMTVLSDDDINQYDVVILKSGVVFTIDDAQITVFRSYKTMQDSSKAIGIITRK